VVTDTNTIFVGNHISHTVSVIDGALLTVTATITGVHSPNNLAYDRVHGWLFVANRDTDSLTVIHTASRTISDTVPVGHRPDGLALLGNKLYVANYGDATVSVLDTATLSVTRVITLPGGTEPAMVAANPVTGKVYVTLHGAGALAVITSATDSLLNIVDLHSPGPYGVAVNSVLNRVYVASIDVGELVTLDGSERILVWRPPDACNGPLRMVAVNENTGHVFVTCAGESRVVVFKSDGLGEIGAWPVGSNPQEGILADPATDRVYVSNRDSNNLTVLQDGLPECP